MSRAAQALLPPAAGTSDRYKWSALFNTTLGVLLVSINESILIIALPDIFRGIKLNPLVPGNSFYLLWILLGFMLVTAVLVVTSAAWVTYSGGSACTTWASPYSRSSPSCCR